MMCELQVYFVIPRSASSEEQCDVEMQQAYSHCSLHSGINVQWIEEDVCLNKANIGKKDVFVLEEFKGRVFNKLIKTKALVVGARCLSCCLTEATPIPPGPHPVYTIAMNGLVISATGLTKEIKEEIRTKVFWMGGKYENTLNESTTHLISNTIFSEKYSSAISSSVPVMTTEWVKAAWVASLQRNVSARDAAFSRYKLPPFFGATITSSGFPKKEKENIAKLIEANGGTFTGSFESTTTDVIVISSNGVGGEKHKAGIDHGKQCVSASWVYESVQAGHAVPAHYHSVYETNTSSPISSAKPPDMSIDVSTIASVRYPVASSSVDDTCSTNVSGESSKVLTKKHETLGSTQRSVRGSRLCPITKELGQLVDGLDMKEVRLAGSILEDCALYVYGVTVARRDKLHRIVDRCGGTRFSTCHDQVTHALCGDPSKGPMDKDSMPKAIHVTTRWLVESVRAKELLDETQYLVLEAVPADKCESAVKEKKHQSRRQQLQDSPMSKRNLQLLQTTNYGASTSGVNTRPPVPLFKLDSLEPEKEKEDIVKLYREHSQMAVGDSEDALAQYFKQGGVTLADNTKENLLPVEQADSNVTLRRGSTRSNESILHIRVKDGDDKTVIEGGGATDAMTMTEMSEDLSDLFNGLAFEFQGIEESSAAELAISITEAGGKVMEIGENDETSNPETTYVIVPLDYDEVEVVNKQAKIINTFWLDDCLTQKKIVDLEYYHRPVKVAPCLHPLKGLTFGISNYVSAERLFVDELAQLLGATTQNTFCRRDTGSSKASTHLICPTAEGKKYEGAVKWGLPVVTSDWLLECAHRGKRMREGPYLIGNTKEPKWNFEESNNTAEDTTATILSTNLTSENKENISKGADGNEMLLEQAGDDLLKEVTMPKEAMEIEEEKIVEVCPVVEPTEQSIKKSVPSDSLTSIKFNTPKGKAKLSLGPSTEMSPVSRILARARMPDSQETPKRISELCKEAKQANDSMRTPPMDNALSTPNLAAFSPMSRRRLLAIKRGEMPSDTIKTPRNPFDATSVETPESPFGAALRPETGHMSADSKKKLQKFINQLPEFEHKNAAKVTPISEMSTKFFSRFGIGTQPSVAKQLHISDAEDTPPAKHRKLDNVPLTNQSIESQLKHLTSIMAAANTTNITPRGKRSFVPDDVEMPRLDPEQRQDITGYCGDSQAYTVGWDDTSQSHSGTKNPTPSNTPLKVYKFIISSNVPNRDEIILGITALGGTVSATSECDATITHLVHCRPSKSEKVLAGLAAGLWLVHPSYIDKSREQGKFINEEEFEWGNPLAVSLPKLESSEHNVAAAAHRWRLAKTQGQHLPFHNMRLLLHVPAARKPPLIRVIVSGNGVALNESVPFRGNIDATLCIAENSLLPFKPEDLDYLVDHRIPVCPPTIISRILIDDPPPRAVDYAYSFYTRRLNARQGV